MITYQLVPYKDADQVTKLKTYCFKPAYEGERLKDFQYWIKESTVVGAYDEQKLVSQLLILPLSMNLFGRSVEMGGIGFVSTYPEYRGKGLMKQNLLESLKRMRANKQLVSVLSPFSVSFYRHFGWELFFDELDYTIPIDQLQLKEKHQGSLIRFDYTEPESVKWLKKIETFHNKEVQKKNGQQFRKSDWWLRLKRREPTVDFVVSLDDQGEINGYIRYSIHDLTFDSKDFYAVDQKTEQLLWQYIKSHIAEVEVVKGKTTAYDSFGFQFAQPQFKKEIIMDKMIRIVDVKAFLEQYPFQEIEQPLYVSVFDTQAEWNNKNFKIMKNNQVEEVNDAPENSLLEIGIGPFSALLAGYHSVDWYRLNGTATVSKEAERAWDKALPKEYPSFYDYF